MTYPTPKYFIGVWYRNPFTGAIKWRVRWFYSRDTAAKYYHGLTIYDNHVPRNRIRTNLPWNGGIRV